MKTIHSELHFQNKLEILELVEFCNQIGTSLNSLTFWRLNEGLDTLANLNQLFQSPTKLQKHLLEVWNPFDAIFLENVMVIFVLACWCNLVFTAHLIFNSKLLIITYFQKTCKYNICNIKKRIIIFYLSIFIN